MKWSDKITVTNEDNMQLMARYPDKYFDLAIVDPPYRDNNQPTKDMRSNGCMKSLEGRPQKEYFDELIRVSKNQIIWGANYYLEFLPSTRGIICWDKKQYMPTFSRIEFAWTSFDAVARLFEGTSTDLNRFHPTQKPVALYKWILDKYAKQGNKILDTHLGSGSIAIACHDYGFDLTACELDKEYFDKAMERISNHTNQQKLF